MIDWTITFHDAVCDHEIEELADHATFHGIDDFTVTESRRIIKAETVRDDDAINWIASWLGAVDLCGRNHRTDQRRKGILAGIRRRRRAKIYRTTGKRRLTF